MGLLGCALPLGSEFQTGAARPEFEVASVKASPWFGSGAVSFNRTVGPAGIDFAGITAKELIVWAYGIKGYQVSGPGWISGEWFDVVAKASGPTPEDQMRLMGRSLLASRFRLQSHTETKLLPVYELVVGKSGLKLHEADPAGGPRYTPGRRGILAKHVSLSRFAELLSNKTDRPVVDKTAIEGFFDIDIEFTPDTGLAPDNELSPSVFAAVQQLGLKLEPHKASIEVLVVDRVERPSQN
jgi:bla regulator protein BlaR1